MSRFRAQDHLPRGPPGIVNRVRRVHSGAALVPRIKCNGHQVRWRERFPGFAEGDPVLAEELDAPLHEAAVPVPG